MGFSKGQKCAELASLPGSALILNIITLK